MTNSPDLDFESAARQSVFLGLVRLNQLRLKYPGTTDDLLIRANASGALTHAGADVATAAGLIDALGLRSLSHDAASMRLFLRALLESHQPSWIVAALRGRQALQAVMPQSVSQCFSFARLLDPSPDVDAVAWWDGLVEAQRRSDGLVLKDRGREGERLTLRYETERLSRLGIAAEPRWVALDDEWLGYDVLSFEPSGNGQLSNRLIEVKACTNRPLRVFLTRNEWNKAKQAQDSFRFHIWHLPTEELTELSWKDLCNHVPLDCGAGTWREAVIVLQ